MQKGGFAVGLGLRLTSLRRSTSAEGGSEAVISATTAPALSMLTDVQTAASGYSVGAYTSSAGTIVSIVETYLVNGTPQASEYGLTAGDSVQVSVLVTDSGASTKVFTTAPVTVTAAGSSATVAVAVTRGSDKVAPEGIWFEATPNGFDVPGQATGEVYNPRLHEIYYSWTFSDAGTWAVPANLLAGKNDRNVAYGPKISHVFETTGTYTVTCVAIDNTGNIATDSFQITVGDPDVVFSGSNTICVALDNDYTGTPVGCQKFNTLGTAITAYKSLGSIGRLLLKKGEIYDVTSQIAVDASFNNFHLGAWGAGAKPVLDSGVLSIKTIWLRAQFNGADFNVNGIRFQGGWDSTTETGPTGGHGLNLQNPAKIVIHDCEFDGISIAIYPRAETRFIFMNDTFVTNWRAYGVFAGAADFATVSMTGMRVMQNVDAQCGRGFQNNTYGNLHGPLRHSFKKLYMDACDLFTRNGSGAADQACVRHNAGTIADVFAYYTRCTFEGGYRVVQMKDSSGQDTEIPGNVIWDGNYMLGSASTINIVYVAYGGVTFRNNIMVKPNQPKTPSLGDYRAIFELTYTYEDTENKFSPVDIYNNIFVNLLDASNDEDVAFAVLTAGSVSKFPNVRVEDNIEYYPNLPVPDAGEVPLDATIAFTARYDGYMIDGNAKDLSYATPAGTAALYQPLPG